MKESNLTFAEGFLGIQSKKAQLEGKGQMAFNWDEAAKIIKDKFKDHPDLIAEAGLQGDWDYTGGIIFEDGFPTNEHYTYLCSNWAKPTLLLFWDGEEQEEIVCEVPETKRLTSSTKWDDVSLEILGIKINSCVSN